MALVVVRDFQGALLVFFNKAPSLLVASLDVIWDLDPQFARLWSSLLARACPGLGRLLLGSVSRHCKEHQIRDYDAT